ncbi:MAG: YigZ family protein [Balneolaceae bacterium]|nr:YigZ family protein [Balneolaceae bacterium]
MFPCNSVDEFDSTLDKLKNRYPDATHHCCAYRILNEQLSEFSSDDGEPSGSAGLPILNTLKSFELVNIGSVVVRYYGGSKLGKAGLIEAYSSSTKECIDIADIGTLEKVFRLKVIYEYPQESQIQQIIHNFDLKEIDQQFTEQVMKIVQGPIQKENGCVQSFEAMEYQGITIELLGHTFVMN